MIAKGLLFCVPDRALFLSRGVILSPAFRPHTVKAVGFDRLMWRVISFLLEKPTVIKSLITRQIREGRIFSEDTVSGVLLTSLSPTHLISDR